MDDRRFSPHARTHARTHGALFALAVGLALGVGFYGLRPHERGGPFGHWTSRTLGESYRAIREAFLAHAPLPSNPGPAPRVGAGTDFALVLCIGSTIVSGLVLLRHTLLGRVGVMSRIAVLGTCALSALFVAWWNPGQPMFWILPWWFLASGASLVLRDARRGSANILGGSTIVLALSLAHLNGLRYVAPSTLPDGRIVAARRMGTILSPKDLLVMQKWSDNFVSYFGGIPSTGLLSLSMHRGPHESGMDALRRRVKQVHRLGGRTYMELPSSGAGYLSEELRMMGLVDFNEDGFENLQWGVVLDSGGTEFREIIEVP